MEILIDFLLTQKPRDEHKNEHFNELPFVTVFFLFVTETKEPKKKSRKSMKDPIYDFFLFKSHKESSFDFEIQFHYVIMGFNID